MWTKHKAMKGQKFDGGVLRATGLAARRHNVDKLGWEIGVSKQQVKATPVLIPVVTALFPQDHGIDFAPVFDIKNARGEVVLLPNQLPGNAHMVGPINLMGCCRRTHKMKITPAAVAHLKDITLTCPWTPS